MNLNVKRLRGIYFALAVFALLLALALWVLAREGVIPMMTMCSNVDYAVETVTQLVSLACVFFAVRVRKKHCLCGMLLLVVPALWIVVLDFVFGKENLLYFIPIQAVAYLFVYPRDEVKEKVA